MLSETLFHKLNWLNVLLLGLGLAPYLELFEQYVFNDWDFAISVSVLVVIDTVTGFWKGYQNKCISSYRFRDVIKKVALYFLLMVVGNVGSSYTVNGELNVILRIFDNLIYGLIMITELLSILENMAELGVPIPVWIKKRLRAFTEEGKLDIFENQKNENDRK